MMDDKTIISIYAKDRTEWRNWLLENHLKESKVNLIKYRKYTGKPSLSAKEAMEEAICFGWIDTTLKKLDDNRYMQRFSKRNKNSKWSVNTLSYGKQLMKEGKMSEAGIDAYKEGLKKKAYDHHIPKNPDSPKDFLNALIKNKKAKENFEKMAPSYRKTYIRRIEFAKRPDTRLKRIKEIIERLKDNKKWGE